MKGPSLWTQGLERGADADVQPSANGRPHVRLRSPEKAEAARPSIPRRLARPLPLIGVALVLAALAGYWSVYSATTAQDARGRGRTRPSGRERSFALSDLRTAELAGDAQAMAALVPEQRARDGSRDESSPPRCRRERRSRGRRLPHAAPGRPPSRWSSPRFARSAARFAPATA